MPSATAADPHAPLAFAEQLKRLPSVAHLCALELLDEAGTVVARIHHQPGEAGALAVYAALAHRHGAITPAAAHEGLELFAEHTAHARQHPGSHPNIDRLLHLLASGQTLRVRLIAA
jgi:hypothetical protein